MAAARLNDRRHDFSGEIGTVIHHPLIAQHLLIHRFLDAHKDSENHWITADGWWRFFQSLVRTHKLCVISIFSAKHPVTQILLGGRPIGEYTREQRNRVFAPVFQDFVRYSISLRENVAVGDIELLNDDEAIRSAAEKGQAAKAAETLKDGFDTLLGRDFEGGVDLSGGQWQRIALSRAFMGNKPVLLLDEPTSQLDPMAESRLYSEFHALAEGKTAIFITHRLASTMITDRILVLSQGRVAEEGTHAQLMEKGGIYRTMFDAQRKWYEHDGEEEAV